MKTTRTAKIVSAIAKAEHPLTHAEIVKLIRAKEDETKFVSSTCLRLVESERVNRRLNRDGYYVYNMTSSQKQRA